MNNLELFEEYFYLSTDSATGIKWKKEIRSGKDKNRAMNIVGQDAGNLSFGGYWDVKLLRKTYRVHRIVYTLAHGCCPEMVDHIDGCKTNNSLTNLREANHTINMQNLKMLANNKSGVTGVHLDRNSWVSAYYLNGKEVRKYFSIRKYGKDEAFNLAVKHRKECINYLNSIGCSYTTRHGQPETKENK